LQLGNWPRPARSNHRSSSWRSHGREKRATPSCGHEALSRLADDGLPVHELQMLAGHASITTTQRYLNARANSLAGSMREARERRARRVAESDVEQVQVG